MLHYVAEGIKVADTIKIAYQLTLRWEGLPGEPNRITSICKSREHFLAIVRKGYDNGRRVGETLGHLL